MKARIRLAEVKNSKGTMALYESDGVYSINFDGQELMHAKASASEELLGSLGAEILAGKEEGKVLIGGLGLGFTLRSVLENVGKGIFVTVVELIPEVVEWNRTHMRALNGELLDDGRVEVVVDDIVPFISQAETESYDAILLYIDNGPVALVADGNDSLYSFRGLTKVKRILKKNGRAIFWSARPDHKFEKRLNKVGFDVKMVKAKVHAKAKRAAYSLYVADLILD